MVFANRTFWKFWKVKLKKLKDNKGSTHPLTFDGKELEDVLHEDRFDEDDPDCFKNMEDFAYQTCQELYATATRNITPFPPTWNGLLNELPFSNDKYGSFVEEYSEAKSFSLRDYRANLSTLREEKKKIRNQVENLSTVLLSLLEIVGIELKKEDLPANLDFEEEHKNLSRKIFFQRLRADLGGRKLIQVLKERNQLERKLHQFFDDDLYLPSNWNEQLTRKEDLDKRENEIRHALNFTNTTNLDNMRRAGDSWHTYTRNLSDKVKEKLNIDSTLPNQVIASPNFDNSLINKRDLGLAPADYGNVATIMNGKTLQELRTDSDNLTNAQNTITTAQTNLGITNLNALPNMRGKTVPQLLTDQQTITGTGKTLAQLIADSVWKTGHICGGTPCGLAHCPNVNHHANYNTLQTESQEYQRIHAKLSGQVSNSELQALLDAIPNCSHTDYDTIKDEKEQLKTENSTLKSENTQLKEHKCDCDSKVAQKEQEIINKIITDLSLSTERERERENLLEAVIAEIKTKITPPRDNTQLKNKETEISELKKGNQSYLDLEKLVEQKQAENQSLTTAKNELESQLNQKQKELLIQVLNKSSEVKEKVYKEEIIKVIEVSLTSQGIDSKSFREEVNVLSSLTDIQELSGKFSSQKVSELKDSQKTAYSLNVALGVLSLGSLIALAYLLIKGAKKDMERGLKETKRK